MAAAPEGTSEKPPISGENPLSIRALGGAAVLLCLLPFACWGVIEATGSFPGDAAMRPWMGNRTDWLDAHHAPGAVKVLADALAGLGTPLVAVAVVAGLALISARVLGRRYALLPVLAALVVFVSDALKELFGPSPYQAATTPEPHPAGTLPSTHAAYAAAVFGFAAWLALRRGARALAVAIVVLILLMGPARMVRAAHWPSDVVAGYALGLGWLLGVLALVSARARRSG